MARKRAGVCTYCGKTRKVTSDHVPPRNLFPDPPPPNLLTVPACAECNGRYSKDDDYFRIALTTVERAKGNPDRDTVVKVVQRGMHKPEAKRFAESFEREMTVVPRFTPTGLYVGHARRIALDGARLDRVAARIVRGLYLKVKNVRLPDDHVVQTVHHGRFPLVPEQREVEELILDFMMMVQEEPIRVFGQTFAFRWLQSPNGEHRTHWLLYFYEQLDFYCTTCPREVLDEDTSPR